MNTNTSLKYLGAAISKASDSMHPNFAAKLKPATKAMYDNIRLQAARAFDLNIGNPRQAIVQTARALKSDSQAYITFFKNLASDCAFAAHMDCVQFERSIDESQLDAGLDAMAEQHPLDLSDLATFDKSDAQRATKREPYSGSDTPEPLATSIDDAYAAIYAVQGWLSQAVAGMTPDQQDYWGVDGLFPLAQRKVTGTNGAVYVKVDDFDDYRELQTELYKAKRSRVDVPLDVEDAMLNS